MSQKFDTLLHADYALLCKEGSFVIEKDQAIGITNSKIEYIGAPSPSLEAKETIELKKHLIMPGLVNAHNHLAMSLFRGLGDNLELMVWLKKYIFPLEESLVDEEFVRIGTELSVLELIKSGVTTCMDMYFYNKAIAEVLDVSGLRGFVGVGIPNLQSGWQDWESHVLNLHSEYQDHSRVSIGLGPHAPYTLSSEALKQAGDFSKKHDMFLTIHVSESEAEIKEIKDKHSKTPVEYLHDLNVTGKKSLFVHGVHMTEKDLDLLAKTGTSFCHCIESNLKLSNGIAPIGEALKRGVTVALGTDGAASNNDLNMFTEMGSAARAQALKYGAENSINAEQTLKLATLGGAKALNLEQKIGSLEQGKQADLIAIDLNQTGLYPYHNLMSNLVYSANGSEVTFSMVEGRVIMRDRKIKTLDENKIYQDVHNISAKIQEFLASKGTHV